MHGEVGSHHRPRRSPAVIRSFLILACLLLGVGPVAAMADIARVQTEMECEQLSMLYAESIDALDPDLFASVFTPDAVWITGAGEIHGRAAIAQFVATQPIISGKHSITNVLITVQDEDHAPRDRLSRQLSLGYRSSRTGDLAFSPNLVGKFTDDFVRQNGRWLLFARACWTR